MKSIGNVLYIITCVATAMVGHSIHGSLFFAILDFIFCPIAWAKWLICHQVNLTIIKHTFAFFLS